MKYTTFEQRQKTTLQKTTLECYENLSIAEAHDRFFDCWRHGLICAAGNLQFTIDEIQEIYNKNLYVETYKKIYRCVKSDRAKTGYRLECIYNSRIPLNKKGHFRLIDAESLKNKMGWNFQLYLGGLLNDF